MKFDEDILNGLEITEQTLLKCKTERIFPKDYF